MSSKQFRKSDGGGMCGVSWRDRGLLIARTLSHRDWEKPKDIQRARHMAHDGAGLAEIAAALGWTVQLRVVSRRLRKYNIRPINPSDRAHRGEVTTLDGGRPVNMKPFRPLILKGVR